MKISDDGLDLIISFEGKLKPLPDGRYIAYQCPAGVWTIYTGCTVGVHEGMIVTEGEGKLMFAREIEKFEGAVSRLVTADINQNQFDALVSFAYNCGEGALAKSTLLKKLNAGDVEGAAAAFKLWNRAGGKVLRGLVRRRDAEAALFLKPMAGEAMPQKVDPPAPVIDAVAKSKTIGGAVVAAVGAAGTYADQGATIALDALTEGTRLSGIKDAFPAFKSVAFLVALAGLLIVISRRISAQKNGKVG